MRYEKTMGYSRNEEPRQVYGLGSLVKKRTRPIKKIIKSPIGKIGLGALALGGMGGFSGLLRKAGMMRPDAGFGGGKG